MPLSRTSTLVDLAKSLAKDPKALAEVGLDCTAATYKLKYGLAESFHLKLVNKLQTSPFLISLEEATGLNMKKVPMAPPNSV